MLLRCGPTGASVGRLIPVAIIVLLYMAALPAIVVGLGSEPVPSEALEDDPWAVTDVPEPTPPKIAKEKSTEAEPKLPSRPSAPKVPLADVLRQAWQRATWRQYVYELLILAFCVAYIANIIVGNRKNAALARAWGQEFCLPGGIFDRNFAQVGTGIVSFLSFLCTTALKGFQKLKCGYLQVRAVLGYL